MFNFSIWEIVLVAVVAFVVLGPERLPAAMQKVGRVVREAKSLFAKTRQEIEQVIQEYPSSEQSGDANKT